MHRDIKPENILMMDPLKLDIYICDFDMATYCDRQNCNFKKCGTAGYVAPEVLNYEEKSSNIYNVKCDIFSAGCVFY